MMILNLLSGLVFVSYAVWAGKKHAASSFLALLIAATFLFGLLVDRVLVQVDAVTLFNLLFTIIVLLIFCHSFYRFSVKYVVANSSLFFSARAQLVLIVLLFLALVINCVVFYHSFSYVVANATNITSFKNQGEGAELIRTWVDPRLVFMSYALSPLSYIALGVHFYYLSMSKIKQSILFFFLSLNILLVGLHGLSRSSMIHYMLLYVFLYAASYRSIPVMIRRRINLLTVLFFILVLAVLYFITDSRFSDTAYYSHAASSFIENQALYSVFDYASQWVPNGILILNDFGLAEMWYGKSSFTIVDFITNIFGLESESFTDFRNAALGPQASAFNGFVSMLVYDFSYVGAFAFALLFFLVIRFSSPSSGGFRLNQLVLIATFSALPIMFFTNNYLSNLMYSLGCFYSFVYFVLLKFAGFKRQSVLTN